uniref:Palmdelphin n=1 Tax=Lates calcarifer TaxID=8187 RepID=A0A4W6EB39_LATCA
VCEKKALREQWLMDGLSQQSEQEQEAMRLQAQDEQQQSDQLQSNILRIEKEIMALEAQELDISANEEVVLKRLKEVERTAEDIIKVGSNYLADLHLSLLSIPATFAMEISVEHDKRTGKSQVISTASITPETIQERGLKVYDDGRKSVYALHPDGGKMHCGAVGEMTHTEVEELLRQATEENVPTEVHYHQPVYSVPYTGNSRPSTPRTPNKTQRQTPTSSPSPFQSMIPSRNGPQVFREENQHRQEQEGWKAQSKTPSPSLIQQDSMSRVKKSGEETKLDNHLIPQPDFGSSVDFNRHSPYCAESNASLNLPDELESEPVTMIFMGYENAADEEEDDIQAELVIISVKNESEGDECLSYHPEGYKSKVFQPKVGIAKVTGCRDITEDTNTHWDDLELHKPTFIHKPGKHSPYLQGQRGNESANTGSINMEKMKLCSTGR